jgi:two-component system sensor kinase FixL
MVMLTPLLLLAPRWRAALRHARTDLVELLLVAASTLVAFALVFVIGNPEDLRFFYLLFVPAIWAALRWETSGLLLGALAIQLGLIVGVQRLPEAAPLVDLQYLMVTLTLTGLALGTVVASRAEAVRLANEREAQQRAIMIAVPDAVLATTDGTTLRSLNPAASRLFDPAPGAARTLDSVFPALELDGREGRALVVARAADGREFPAEIAWASHERGSDTQTLIIVRDVTERERAQAQLRERDASLARASRAAVAGELATALTHELNQPMTALVTYLRAARILAQGAAADEPRLQPTLDKAGDEARRAATILQRLRNFYGGGGPRRERVAPRELVVSAVESQRRAAQRDAAEISLVVEADLPDVLIDRVHFEIALFNLLSNAQDVLRESVAPRIEVTALRRDGQVVVRVEDNGPGIPPEVAGRAFEAFVTTKPDGMGMGLAVSRSLMRAQGGDLVLTRGRLGGAGFEIRLPVESAAQEHR